MSNVATKAKKPNLSVKSVLNWILDHAMIIVIVLLALYVQTQRDAFLKPASLINIISLTAARLPMALGVAGCIILAGTDLTGGRVAGLTAFVAAILLQRADVANRVLAGGAPANIVLVLLLVMLIGACVGLINGFVMAKFKVHPYIITLAMQMIVYGFQLGAGRFLRLQLHHQLRHQAPVPNSNRRSPQRHCHLHRGSHVCAAGADRDRADVGRLEQDRFRQKHVCRRF